jgi:hypothetical protein
MQPNSVVKMSFLIQLSFTLFPAEAIGSLELYGSGGTGSPALSRKSVSIEAEIKEAGRDLG